MKAACVKMEISWITAISLMHSQDIDLFGNIIVKLINIELFDLLACCHYILNSPRMYTGQLVPIHVDEMDRLVVSIY